MSGEDFHKASFHAVSIPVTALVSKETGVLRWWADVTRKFLMKQVDDDHIEITLFAEEGPTFEKSLFYSFDLSN